MLRSARIATILLLPLAANAGDWTLIKEQDGIRAYKRDIPGSDIVAFKGEGLVEATPLKVASVLMDISRKLEWVDRILEARLVKQLGPLERVEYNRSHVPWPLSDRDFVFHALAKVEPDGAVVFELKSVEDAAEPPHKGLVRGRLVNSGYRLEPVEGGARTRITVEIQADPRGSVPKWIANLVQKKWPIKTILGIRSQSARADHTESPEMAKALKKAEGSSKPSK